MSGFQFELQAVLRTAAGDPYRMHRLRRLAESAGCFTGYETDADLVAALGEAGGLSRLGPEGLFEDPHTGAWAEMRVGPADIPDEPEEDALTAQRAEPEFDLDQARQAATLEAAAQNGTPFCEECERARQAQEAGA